MLQSQYYNHKLTKNHIEKILTNYNIKYNTMKNEIDAKFNSMIKLFVNDIRAFLENIEEINNERKRIKDAENNQIEISILKSKLEEKSLNEIKLLNEIDFLTKENYSLKTNLKIKKSKSKSKKKTKSKNTNEFNTTHSLILKTEERPIKSRYIFNKEKIKANKLKIKPINKTKKNNRSNNQLSLSMEKRTNKYLDNFKSDSTKEKKTHTNNSMEKRPINKIKNINVQNKKIKNKNIKNYFLNRTPDNKSMTVNSSGKASSTNIKGKNNKTVCNEQKLNINEATHLEQSIGEDESLVTIDDVIDEELKELEKDEENIILLMEQIKNLSNELEEN